MKIKEYIRINKLTYRSFAELVGLSPSTVHHFISGKNKSLSFSTIQKIVKGTSNRITFEDLMEENLDKSN